MITPFTKALRRRCAERLSSVEKLTDMCGATLFPELSPTRRAVALLIVAGHGDTRAHRAEFLKMNLRVYDTHRLALLRKMGVKTDVQLALVAWSRRLSTAAVGCRLEDQDLVIETAVSELRVSGREDLEALMEVLNTALALRL